MSVERYLLVALDEPYRSEALTLHARSAAALARTAKALPGDRSDVVRHERAQSALEALALAARNAGAPSAILEQPVADHISSALLDETKVGMISAPQAGPVVALAAAGFAVVEVPWPFSAGPTPMPPGSTEPSPPARRWPAERGVRAIDAVRSRFRRQVERAATATSGGSSVPPEAIVPSGVPNSTLTETLREFASTPPDQPAVHVPVRYRDGSTARPFPLRAMPMTDQWESSGRVLRFALLSIRHVELDPIVDGAWLRNTEVSRPRPMGQTDELVYTISREQLGTLTERGPISLLMYQTGLEPAVVGFYRAVVDHLLIEPASVAVLPCYYQAAGGFAEGTPWRSR